MNIHHLELFYYVARHGGISGAVRNIPYGIQQPAVSVQVLQLEDYLGTKLFDRRPFQLTPAGGKLYAFIEPFFSNVARVAGEIRGQATQFIRFGASNTALRTHGLDLLIAMRGRVPDLRFSLHDAIEPVLLGMIEKDEIDLALTVVPDNLPAGVSAEPLLSLPLVLLVPRNSRIKDASELWKRDKIEHALISLPPIESMTRRFQQGLSRLGVDWISTLQVNSLDLIEIYTASGFGIGLTLDIPRVEVKRGLRALPLEGFEPVEVGALWRGKPTPLISGFLEEMRLRAEALVGPGNRVSSRPATGSRRRPSRAP